MSLVKNRSSDIEVIIEYLRDHPDFFVTHPELLTQLTLPAVKDKTVASFLEYQAIRLRQTISALQTKITAMEDHALLDNTLSTRIYALALELLTTQTPETLYLALHKGLRTHYAADRVLLMIFNKANSGGANPKLRFMFTEVFHRNKPLCGSLQEEHLQALFGKDSERIKSTVLLPLDHPQWQGLLVLGSELPDQYGYGHALDLLVFLKDIIDLRIMAFTKAGQDRPLKGL